MSRLGVSRRRLLRNGASAAILPVAASFAEAEEPAPVKAQPDHPSPSAISVSLTVNGEHYRLSLDPRTTLLDALREHLALTGAKKGCDQGQCGTCTVLVGNRRVLACLTLAASVTKPVMTIEGLSKTEAPLHPMQQAFIDQDAFQCGYCTPGQIMSAIGCVSEGHAETDDDIRKYMSGNLCRCAAYPHIVAAIKQAKPQTERLQST